MKKSARVVALTALSALVAGCAGRSSVPPPSPLVQLSSTLPCTADFHIPLAKPLGFDAEKPSAVELTINESSTCLLVNEGQRSLYDMVMLPTLGSGYILSIESVPMGAGIFSPHVFLLDGEGKVRREIPRDDFVYRGGSLTAMLRAKPEDRYLVVGSDPETVGIEDARIQGMTHVTTYSTYPGIYTSVYTGSESTRHLTYSHTGKVRVVAQAMPTAN